MNLAALISACFVSWPSRSWAERLDVQLRGDRAVSTILLMKALGGDWERNGATELALAGKP